MKALLRQCFFISIITEDFVLKRTTNYALPDWEKSDFIQMSDFNDLTHKLDTALKSHDDTLNTKADTSAVTAVQQTVCRIATMVAHPFHLKKDGAAELHRLRKFMMEFSEFYTLKRK